MGVVLHMFYCIIESECRLCILYSYVMYIIYTSYIYVSSIAYIDIFYI